MSVPGRSAFPSSSSGTSGARVRAAGAAVGDGAALAGDSFRGSFTRSGMRRVTSTAAPASRRARARSRGALDRFMAPRLLPEGPRARWGSSEGKRRASVVGADVLEDGGVELGLVEGVRAHAHHVHVILVDDARAGGHLLGGGRVDVAQVGHVLVVHDGVEDEGVVGVFEPVAHLLRVDADQAVVIVLVRVAVALARGAVVVAVIHAVAVAVD